MERRTALENALNQVEGWLRLDEAWALHEAVRDLPGGAVIVVEIGSWKGRSTIALALAVKVRGSGRVFAIDPHTGDEGRTAIGPVRTLEEFRANISRANVDGVTETLVTTSHFARAQFADGSVDFLFIDGSHEYPDVRRDVEDWVSALKNNAEIAFNDPTKPGVFRTLGELVLRSSLYSRPRLIQNTLLLDFERYPVRRNHNAKVMRRFRLVLWLRFHANPYWRFVPRGLVPVMRRAATKLVSH